MFVLAIYKVTKGFPREELYGLTSQLRRASVSVPTNLAEGCGRDGDKELARFVSISLGSAFEAEYLLKLSLELAYLSPEQHQELAAQISEIKQMLTGLLKKLKAAIAEN